MLWDKLADLAQSYLKKGSQVYVEGRLQTRDWEDQQGQKHYKTEVVVTTMQFLDSKMSDSSSNTEYSATAAAPQSNPAPTAPAEANADPQGDDYIKDDIPF